MDIEEAHICALRNNKKYYRHPITKRTMYTEIAHLTRGKCCGNRCPHCPYGWVNVRLRKDFVEDDDFVNNKPVALLESGDKEAAQKLLKEIQLKYQPPCSESMNETKL